MAVRSILFLSLEEDFDRILDESFQRAYRSYVATPQRMPELPADLGSIALLVVSGYSLQELAKQIPGMDAVLAELPSRIPRLYLLQETDPSLSLVPLKGDLRFFYLRGPLSLRTLRHAVDQILAMKPRLMRFELPPELGITGRFTIHSRRQGAIHCQKELEEISPTGFSFKWDTSDPLIYPGDLLEELELRAHERPFLQSCAQVKHLSPLRDGRGIYGMRVGVEFVDASVPSEAQEGRSASFLDDPLVIRTVLEDAVERKTDVLIRGESHSWELSGTMLSYEGDQQRLQVQVNPPGLPDEIHALDILSCQFVRDNAQLAFSSVLLEPLGDGSTLYFRLPKRLDKLWARATLRYQFDEDNAPTVQVFTPLTPKKPLERQITNLSPHGLCFWADPQQDLLFRGMKLTRMELMLPNGAQLTVEGEVRYLGPRKQNPPPKRIPCGVQFHNLSTSDHLVLINYLIAKNFPQVRDAGPEDEVSLWNFLEHADFYTPSKRQECLGTPDEVRETQARMLRASPSLSRKIVFKEDNEVYGTVSLQQVYQHTWMVHHLCAVRHPVEFVPKSLLLFMGEYITKTPDIDYVKMMWRPNNTWSNKMFGRLVHRLHDGEKSVVKVYSYLHRPDEPLPPPTLDEADWKVRPIEPDEVMELESYFIQQEEFFLMKSEGLIRGEIGLERLDTRYRALGLFRERKAFVVFEGPKLAGFVLAERSSPGLNLSNLLNAFQMYTALTDPERLPGLKRALLRYVIQWYASMGQRRTVAMTEDSDLSVYSAMGYTKVKEYVSWTFDHNIANIYNLYCYYIFRLYERIEQRRQARRERLQR